MIMKNVVVVGGSYVGAFVLLCVQKGSVVLR